MVGMPAGTLHQFHERIDTGDTRLRPPQSQEFHVRHPIPGILVASLTAVTLGASLLVPASAVAQSPVPGTVSAVAGAEARDSASGTSAVADRTVWLCRPGQRPNPCQGDLTTTRLEPRPGRSSVFTPVTSPRKPVDCFYLYPTVSEQKTAVANLDVDPQEVSIAQWQAARFSQVCRVYAPMYRQVTLPGLGGLATAADWKTAYASVLAGWRSYLRHYNNGRGVVLIGHSQGSGQLRRLIADTVDKNPGVRDRLVSALLTGTSVAVKKGTVSGGDFANIPGCTRASQFGCVISYATFDQTPPDDTIFGTLGTRPSTGKPWGSRYEALCSNPASLSGGTGDLRPLYRSTPIYGVLGVGGQQVMFSGAIPEAATPWLVPEGRYTARCITANGARVLMATGSDGAQQLVAAPLPSWGLHLVDINLPLGNLISVVRAQITHYDRAHPLPRRAGLG